jgi:hypothetical protein
VSAVQPLQRKYYDEPSTGKEVFKLGSSHLLLLGETPVDDEVDDGDGGDPQHDHCGPVTQAFGAAE